ncbi:hypothetical protein SORBI_3005G039350 [Sorghum bicolor]|uniref:Uncharacterized protein n=1 Tax=Sorghum bicolor TaxID=4558 RepID=A0A1Z5RGJ1_SORBI|nr:hypothetical protein SORBI_3005G039350 [Sorghum bicolor]
MVNGGETFPTYPAFAGGGIYSSSSFRRLKLKEDNPALLEGNEDPWPRPGSPSSCTLLLAKRRRFSDQGKFRTTSFFKFPMPAGNSANLEQY